jgi:hypothetical protein
LALKLQTVLNGDLSVYKTSYSIHSRLKRQTSATPCHQNALRLIAGFG